MKILVSGNCQAEPVISLLSAICGDVQPLEPIITYLPQDAQEQEDVHKARMREADIIFAQATMPTAIMPTIQVPHVASASIKAHFPEKTIIWPNLFYAGQQPYLCYVTHQITKARLLGPMGEYHDLRILRDWYRDRRDETPFNLPDAGQIAQTSLEELGRREAPCDVKISDLIDAEKSTRRLFFTFNHPSRWLFIALVERMMARTNLKGNLSKVPPREPLAQIVVPSIWHQWPQNAPPAGAHA